MAKDKKTAAPAAQTEEQKAQTTTTPANEENIVDQLRAKNLQSSKAVADAIEQIQKDKDEQKKREAMNAIKKHEYKNMRALLELRKRRAEDKATKEYLNDTQETLNQYLEGKLTATEADKKDREDENKKAKAFDKIDREFSDQIHELKNAYPGYWSYDWECRW